MTPSKGSATPEGKPTAREAHVQLWDAINEVVATSGGNTGNTSVRRQKAVVKVEHALAALTAARDALHAETLRAALASRAADRELIAVRAALQHGEERERVMREALERARDSGVSHNDDLKMCQLCHRFQNGKNYPPGHGKDGVAAPDWYDEDWLVKAGGVPPACVVAVRALATAQAMKEGT